MVEINLIDFIIIIVSAILAIQIAEESTLALWFKQRLFLSQPYSKALKTFGKFKAWSQLMGTIVYVLSPIVIVCIILLRVHAFFFELLECSKCASVWLAAFSLYFILEKSITESIVLAPLAIFFVYIINIIRQHEK